MQNVLGELVLQQESCGTKGEKAGGSLAAGLHSNKVLEGPGSPRGFSVPAWLGYPPGKRVKRDSIHWFAYKPNILVPSRMNNVSAFQEMRAVLLVMIMASQHPG